MLVSRKRIMAKGIARLVIGLCLISLIGAFLSCTQNDEPELAPALLNNKRVSLMNGMTIEFERGKLYHIITSYEDPNPPRPLTPAQQKRHIELCEKLKGLTQSPNEAAHQDEIRRVMDELTQPEYKGLSTGWTSYAYYWYPLAPDQPRPPKEQAILVDLRGMDESARGDTWRIVGRWQ